MNEKYLDLTEKKETKPSEIDWDKFKNQIEPEAKELEEVGKELDIKPEEVAHLNVLDMKPVSKEAPEVEEIKKESNTLKGMKPKTKLVSKFWNRVRWVLSFFGLLFLIAISGIVYVLTNYTNFWQLITN